MSSKKQAHQPLSKEVEKKIIELKKELFNLKMQGAITGFEKPHLLSEKRKEIARLLTAREHK